MPVYLFRRILFTVACAFIHCAVCLCMSSDSLTYSHMKKKHELRTYAAPVALFTASLFTIPDNSPLNRIKVRDAVQSGFPGFRTHMDDGLWAVPAAGAYALHLAGVKGRNDLLNTTLLFLKSQLFTEILVEPLKYTTRVLRPDSSTRNSFPSGHTARAFAVATCFHREFGDKSIWYSIGGYTIASATGLLRIMNNRHWITDVLGGAAIGIVSAQLAYGTHRYRWGKRPVQLSCMPVWFADSGKQLMFVINW